jgi:transposase
MFNDVFSDVSYAGSAMRGEILGAERRRFWHDDDKLDIVMSVRVGGASVTQVAQHERRRQQICAWRHDLKKKGLWSSDAGALFYPVDIPVTSGVAVPQLPELRLRGGRCLHFDSKIDPIALTSLIGAVETA